MRSVLVPFKYFSPGLLRRVIFQYRRGRTDQVEMHLKGITALVKHHEQHGLVLSEAIRRAIFWSNLLPASMPILS